jgi:hypothetical protein
MRCTGNGWCRPYARTAPDGGTAMTITPGTGGWRTSGRAGEKGNAPRSTLDAERMARNLIICHDNLAVSLPETGDILRTRRIPRVRSFGMCTRQMGGNCLVSAI